MPIRMRFCVTKLDRVFYSSFGPNTYRSPGDDRRGAEPDDRRADLAHGDGRVQVGAGIAVCVDLVVDEEANALAEDGERDGGVRGAFFGVRVRGVRLDSVTFDRLGRVVNLLVSHRQK